MNVIIQAMKAITIVNKSMPWFIGSLIAIVSFLLALDVVLRYFFSAPTVWAFDLSTWSTGVVAFLLGGYALAKGHHVRVDILFERFSERTKSIVDVIGGMFLLLIAGTLVVVGFSYVIHYFQIGATSSGGMEMPLWVQWSIVPIGGLLIGLQGLVKLINDIAVIMRGKPLYVTEEEE